jgi:RecA-family ATPase
MPAASISIIADEGGVGKSTLIAQMGLMLANGTADWFGFKIPAPVRVLYLQAEGARHVFLSRLNVAGFRIGVNDRADSLPFFVQPAGDWVKDIGEETERMVCQTGAQFCTIDTQGLFHAADENSNTEIKLHLIKPLQAIAARTGCAFMLIHHLSKPSKDRPGGRHQIRGASAFVDDTDLSMLLEAPDGPTKPRRTLSFTKNRSGPHPEPIELEYISEEARFRTFDSEAAEAAKREAEELERRRKMTDLADKMFKVIHLNPRLNGEQVNELMAGHSKDRNLLTAVRHRLLEEKRIFAEKGEGRSLLYYAANL